MDKIPLTSVLVYAIKQSDGEDSVMLELWGMRSSPSLSSLPDPLWLQVQLPDRVVSMVKKNCLAFKL